MSIGILGKKIGMTQIFDQSGNFVPITLIEAGPCPVLQVKTNEKDGYTAIQIGFGDVKKDHTTKPMAGHFKKSKCEVPKRFIKEIRIEDTKEYEVGQVLGADIFAVGDLVNAIGTSLGRGFQGGVKRWGWRGGPKSHGSMHHKQVGSLSASSYPSRIFKGTHMPGHMGHQRCTVQNLEVIDVDKEKNLIALKGSIPGHKNGFLILHKSKRVKKKSGGAAEAPKAGKKGQAAPKKK